MRRHNTFWALVLIVVGILLLLDNLGALAFLGISVWGLFWPLLLIALGVWVLWGVASGRPSLESREAAIPLTGAGRARVHVHHGAGRLQISGGAGTGQLLSGSFRGGVDCRTRQDGDLLEVEMHVPSRRWACCPGPWHWGPGSLLDWSFRLSGEVPLALDLETGANDAHLDLADLRVTDLGLKTGASATVVTLPVRAGHTQVRLEAGVAAITVHVPTGVAARIRVEGALSGTGVDTTRFPRTGEYYQSADYDTAANRADVRIQSGLGSVQVR